MVTHVLSVVCSALLAQDPGYWHEGRAEVCRYALEVQRYGEMRQGYAVLIFVTEDFLRAKQVKDERGAGAESVNVLKLNRIERFATGMYDYSLMASAFTEYDTGGEELPRTFKTTASIQDWCGHVWLQTNRRDAKVEVVGHSYFEAEADERFELPAALLEDEIFTQIRLGARRLPLGAVKVIPSAFRVRLDHRPLQVESATATMEDLPRDPRHDMALREYRLAIDLGAGKVRTLAVRFLKGFPFHITQFEETLRVGEGETTVLSRALLEKTERVDYWTKHGREHDPLRAELGLGPVK